jgi:predicted RNA methylase
MDSKSVYGRHQMLRPPGELPSFEKNKIGEQKINFFYPLWINEKLKHKRLVKT